MESCTLCAEKYLQCYKSSSKSTETRRRAALWLDTLWPFMSRNYRDKLNNYKMAIGHIHGPYKMMIGSKGEKGPLICDQKQNVILRV